MGKVSEQENLSDLFAVTDFSVYAILPLLLVEDDDFKDSDKVNRGFISDLKRIQLVEDIEVKSQVYRRIRGIDKEGVIYTLWIDEALLIHTLEVEDLESPFHKYEVYMFEPEMNLELRDRDLDLQGEGLIRAPKEFSNPLKGLFK